MAICSPPIARRNQRPKFWLASCTVKVFMVEEYFIVQRATSPQYQGERGHATFLDSFQALTSFGNFFASASWKRRISWLAFAAISS
jgi:hypothetical protein